MNITKAFAVLIAASISSISSVASAATINWDGGGDGVNFDDPLNWDGDVLPGAADLVFPGPGASVTITNDQTVGAYRLNNGGTLIQTGGTLTTTAGAPDPSHFGEFGPGGNSHIMSGNSALVLNDNGINTWGRPLGGSDTLTMTGDSTITVNSTSATFLGMDGSLTATLSDNASFTTAANLQLARFQSPNTTVTLSDSASLSTKWLIMSDAANFEANSLLTLNGSTLSVDATRLFMRDTATLSFVADAGGISTINLAERAVLTDNANPKGPDPQLLVDLSAYAGLDDLVLIDRATDDGGIVGQFRDLPEGAVVPGTGGRIITYVGGADGLDVVLITSTTLSTTIAPNSTNPGNYDFTWTSQDGKLYDLVSNTDLSTAPETWPIWESNENISGTAPENTLSDILGGAETTRFFAVLEKDPPPMTLLDENFDSTIAGSLPADWTNGKNNPPDSASTTNWELGTPDNVGPVPPGVPLPSADNCVATAINGNYDDPVDNNALPFTDIWLRSPAINLGSATQGTLSFQQWTEIESAAGDLDYGSIRILDASDDSELAVMENRTIDGSTVDWEEYSMELPAAAFTAPAGEIKIEWRFEADDIDSFAGWYIDDVMVTAQ